MAQERIAAAGEEGGHQAVGRRFDVYRQDAVGADGGDRGGGVVFVRLDAIGKPNCDEGGIPPFRAKLPHGALGQEAGSEGIDTSTDAQHIGCLAAFDEIALQKRDPFFYFIHGIEIRLNPERLDDR